MCRSQRHKWQAIFFTVILVTVCTPVPAMPAAVSMEYFLGFNGHFKLNSWTPITVVLENRGKPTDGKLEVIVTSGSEFRQDVTPTTYALEADLPHNSKKRFTFTVLIKSFTHDLIIRLRQNDNILISKSINLRPHFTEKKIAVVGDIYVSPDILSVLPEYLYPVNVRPEFLPENWNGYNGVELLIMRVAALRRLSERQFQALTRWIKMGGYLITTGGINYGSLHDNRTQHFLPVQVHGHKQLNELGSLADFCNQPLTVKEPFLVLDVKIEAAKIILQENDLPIIFQKKFGTGQIGFLSFDYNTPPFSRWDGRKKFWKKMLSLHQPIQNQGIVSNDQQIFDSMVDAMPVMFPDVRSGLIFVGVYIGLLGFFLKKVRNPGRSRRQFSIYILILIVAFTIIGCWHFFYPTVRHRFSYNSFCQLVGYGQNKTASAKYILGLYSLKKLTYHLSFGTVSEPVIAITLKQSKRKIPHPYTIVDNYAGQRISGFLDKWTHSFYMIHSTFDSPISGNALGDRHQLILSIENKFTRKIINCLIYFKKRFLLIDDIPANKRQTITVKLAELKKTEIFNEQEIERIIDRLSINPPSPYLKTIQNNLMKDLLVGIDAKYRSEPNSMVLIGWVKTGIVHPVFENFKPLGENLTLVNWELPVEINS
jgi:hypothetical protein